MTEIEILRKALSVVASGDPTHSSTIVAISALDEADKLGKRNTKPEVEINDWYVIGKTLCGRAVNHPILGNTWLRSSTVLKIETRNTMYILGESNLD